MSLQRTCIPWHLGRPPFSQCTFEDYVLESLDWGSGGRGVMHSQLMKNEDGVEIIWMEGLCILGVN